MKFSLYIAGLAFIIVSCSTTRNFSSIMEDDIYYVPGKKALAIQEVENLTGHDIGTEQPVQQVAVHRLPPSRVVTARRSMPVAGNWSK